MQAFRQLSSRFICLEQENIDTDQIIPARFLKQTHKEGLSDALFYDWRHRENGSLNPENILNHRAGQNFQILVAGKNFGCGSSREHAVWALQSYGFRVIISPSMGDIFKSNAIKNGVLPIEVTDSIYASIRADRDQWLEIYLQQNQLHLQNGRNYKFALDEFARLCLLEGVDQLGYLLGQNTQISAFEQRVL